MFLFGKLILFQWVQKIFSLGGKSVLDRKFLVWATQVCALFAFKCFSCFCERCWYKFMWVIYRIFYVQFVMFLIFLLFEYFWFVDNSIAFKYINKWVEIFLLISLRWWQQFLKITQEFLFYMLNRFFLGW